ncbi:hypothetical protein [Synechococcus phage Yong-L1-251]|nr:hypothetical protein [Synechococcus phage Yong-L1-251]
MLRLLNRISTVIRLSRSGRGEDLDRVMSAMEEGARFEGAAGVMLLALAKDHALISAWMGRSERRFIPNAELGERYSKELKAHLYATRHKPFAQEDLPS